MAAWTPSEAYSLCIQCRGTGHQVINCREEGFMQYSPTDDLPPDIGSEWDLSSERQTLSLSLSVSDPPSDTCPRCMLLDIPSWLNIIPPFNDQSELERECDKRPGLFNVCALPNERCDTPLEQTQSMFKSLGLVETVHFDSRCGLCRCIFYICPIPSSRNQSITLVLSWTVLRLRDSCNIEAAGMSKSSRIVTAVFEPFPADVGPQVSILHDGDGLVVAEGQDYQIDLSLKSSSVCPDVINVDAVREWLRLCTERHPTYCASMITENHSLMRLIDVTSRKIVPYSSTTQEYLTLSYVWGKVDQSFPGAGVIGAELPTLPQTLEDAMMLTSQLGHRYIWIDAVCISQDDSDDKRVQIAMMNDIYQGSFATIVALSAEDAHSGLARVSSPGFSSQMSCAVDGVILRTIGPTLTSLIPNSIWDTRAWTYQEGRLSPRCIFVSDYGVYFECNTMTCSEALNIDISAMHLSLKDDDYFQRASYEEIVDIGFTRNPVATKVPDTGKALNIYSLLASQYGDCEITHASDRLAAFSGMLKALQAMAYADGFFWGMPHAHLNWAMSWQASNPAEVQCSDFPSWTWLRHMGHFWPGCPSAGVFGPTPESCPFDLELACYCSESASSFRTIFSQTYTDMSEDVRNLLCDDPIANFATPQSREDLEIPSTVHGSHLEKLLLFKGFALNFAIHRRWEEDGNRYNSQVEVTVAGHTIGGITTYDPDSEWCGAGKQLFLLLARHVEEDEGEQDVLHNMILLKPVGECYERADMLRLHVPVDKLFVLRELGLHRLSGALI